MKLEIYYDWMEIIPESIQDEAYLKERMGYVENYDSDDIFCGFKTLIIKCRKVVRKD
jgi:hypothetical protein